MLNRFGLSKFEILFSSSVKCFKPRSAWITRDKSLPVPLDVVQPFEPWPQEMYKLLVAQSLPTYGRLSGDIGRNPCHRGVSLVHFRLGKRYFVWSTKTFRMKSLSGFVSPTKSANPVIRIRFFPSGQN